MNYERTYICGNQVPRSADAAFQCVIDTYASETNKTASVWALFSERDLDWRPHAKSSTVQEIMRHQLLSERRFFAEFLGSPEPPAAEILPNAQNVAAFIERLIQLASARLKWLSDQTEADWLRPTEFFDVE